MGGSLRYANQLCMMPFYRKPQIFCVAFILFHQSFATLCVHRIIKMEWTGTYNDPIYGGFINVCVSSVDGIFFGQALFSEIGYMRGTIDGALLWTGNFWSAGYEIKRGTFSLQLTLGAPTTFSGTFYEMPGINYDISSTQLSSVEPTNEACFKTDDSLLSVNNPPFFNLNGSWSGTTFQYSFVNPINYQMVASFGLQPGSIILTLVFMLTATNAILLTAACGCFNCKFVCHQ